MKNRGWIFAILYLRFSIFAFAVSAQTTRRAWVDRSDENAKVLLNIWAKFEPEEADSLGVAGLDEKITDLTAGFDERREAATLVAVAELQTRLEKETEPNVRLDLQLLIDSAEREIRGDRLHRKFELPNPRPAESIFWGVRSLLDDQVAPERRPAALARLRRYAGGEAGLEPFISLARQYVESKIEDRSLRYPTKDRIEADLAHDAQTIAEIGSLFEKYKIDGYQDALEKLNKQIAAYDDFVRAKILPRARVNFRLPAELYAFELEHYGVDMPVAELRSRASAAFRETQNEMASLAPLVAKEKGFAVSDYRGVLRELKKTQIPGDAIRPYFEKRIKSIEAIIRRENVVTLPARPMRFRLASAAETAMSPTPHFDSPRLIGNTGEQGEFVLPLTISGGEEKKALPLDDFTSDAWSWTLTAHEGRPGHDLQYAALAEEGISLARAVYAFNSVNVEGWALYCEAEMRPYWPLDGQLAALQARLMRIARAILDPGLQDGSITRDQAMRVLEEDVGLSEGTALQEVERYTFRSPGQATAYYCGYLRLMELRADVERTMGAKFDRCAFHDFILAQGLLPPRLMREAVMKGFVGERS